MTSKEEIKQLLQKARVLCSKSEKCGDDIFKYLQKKDSDINTEQISEIIINLKTENYINETRYANSYVNDKYKFNKWGKTKISYHLKQKHIEEKIITEALKIIDNTEYYNILTELLKNKTKQLSKIDDEYKKKAALIRFAMNKGFESEIIYKILGEE